MTFLSAFFFSGRLEIETEIVHNKNDQPHSMIIGGSMQVFLEFLHQKVPAAGRVMPAYYRRALVASESILACYFLMSFFLFPLMSGHWEWVPALMCLVTVALVIRINKLNIIQNFLLFTAAVVIWCGWGIHHFGWGYGLQHFLVVLLLFLFFNVCIPPKMKILMCLAVLAYRMGLFSYAGSRTPVYSLDHTTGIIFQTANSTGFFLLVAVACILFSSSLQDTERKLRLDNETLNKEAGTDPLTGLPNRREMISIIENYQKSFPETPFSIAIADIDFFKKINDTYGHSCGDKTLVSLTSLFESESQGRYRACRWGGEEFCFFLPEKNIDEAGVIMNDLNFAVEQMPLEFDGVPFSITITIGVEETDFKSTLEELLKSADHKLYIGKNSGRNRVII